MKSPVSVGVCSLGNWGTAIAHHCARNGCQVLGWAREPEVVAGVNDSRRNPIYLSEFELHSNLKAVGDLSDLSEVDLLVLVVPSAVVPALLEGLQLSKSTIVVSAIKGVIGSQALTPLQALRAKFGSEQRLAVLSGPSFASEVIAGKPAGVVSASDDENVAKAVAELFGSESLKVYISTDPLGVELGGVLKNIIALAVGVSDGLGLGDSARAGLITRGLAEITRLARALGADERTLAGLSGLGDLVMTATCDTSRNRTVGLRLGRGDSLADIVKTLGSVAEGVQTTPLALGLAKRVGVELPIAEQVALLLNGQTTPQQMVQALIRRPLKHELDRLGDSP